MKSRRQNQKSRHDSRSTLSSIGRAPLRSQPCIQTEAVSVTRENFGGSQYPDTDCARD